MSMRSFSLVAALIISLTFTASQIRADSPCEGLGKGACESDSGCVWVSGYTKKDGTSVKAYCRSKPHGEKGDKNVKKERVKKETAKHDDGEKKKADIKEKKKSEPKEKSSKDKTDKGKSEKDGDVKKKKETKKKNGE